MGRVKSGHGTLLGNAGEHYVLAELLRRNVVAGLTPRNAPGIDILGRAGTKSLRIRVKTKSDEASSWVWVAKTQSAQGVIFPEVGLNDPDDLIALVDIPKSEAQEVYWFHTNIIDSVLKRNHQNWLNQPGRNGKKHNPSKMRRLDLDSEFSRLCTQHRLAWDSISQGLK